MSIIYENLLNKKTEAYVKGAPDIILKNCSYILIDKKIIRLTDYTLPGLVGTIKKEGQFVDGIISDCAGKTLVVDEIQNVKQRVKNALLDLLENQQHQRNIGYNVLIPIKKNKDFL